MPFDPEENARRMRAAASDRQSTHQRKQWTRILGVAIVILGGAIGVSHWLAHLGILGTQPPGWMDLAIGYPTAALLLAAGGIIIGRRTPTR